MEDLVKHLGIGRQSLYNAFSGKRDLFIAALKHYADQKTAHVVNILENNQSGRKAISRVFYDVLETEQNEREKGCLIVNTAIELAPDDPEIADLVQSNGKRIEQAFYRALVRAKNQGELGHSHDDLLALARFLNNARGGLMVTAKSTSDTDVLRNIIQITLSVLDKKI